MPSFELPQMALYHNQWNGLDNREIFTLFAPLDFDQVAVLRPGQSFWYDQDPIYHHGKVYGYVRKVVTRVEMVDKDKLRLHFRDGMTTVERGRGNSKVYDLLNPESLVRLVSEDRRIGAL